MGLSFTLIAFSTSAGSLAVVISVLIRYSCQRSVIDPKPILDKLSFLYLGFKSSTYFFTDTALTYRELQAYLFVASVASFLFPLGILSFLAAVVLGERFGINSGESFQKWVTDILAAAEINWYYAKIKPTFTA